MTASLSPADGNTGGEERRGRTARQSEGVSGQETGVVTGRLTAPDRMLHRETTGALSSRSSDCLRFAFTRDADARRVWVGQGSEGEDAEATGISSRIIRSRMDVSVYYSP